MKYTDFVKLNIAVVSEQLASQLLNHVEANLNNFDPEWSEVDLESSFENVFDKYTKDGQYLTEKQYLSLYNIVWNHPVMRSAKEQSKIYVTEYHEAQASRPQTIDQWDKEYGIRNSDFI